MDEDLANLSRDALIAEVRRLRDGIRKHRDSSGQELAGIIRRFGRCCPNERTLSRRYLTGRRSCMAV